MWEGKKINLVELVSIPCAKAVTPEQAVDVSYQLLLTRSILCFCPSRIGDALANLVDCPLVLKS